MSRKKTRAELEAEIARLQPYTEAVVCLQKQIEIYAGTLARYNDDYVLIHSGEAGHDSYRSIRIVGLGRASGGVVVTMQGEPCGAQWLTDVIIRWSTSIDPYEREVASKAQRALKAAIETRDAIRKSKERFERSEYVVRIDGVRYARTNGQGSLLKELVDYGGAYVPGGRVIHADDPRHPDRDGAT